MPGWTTTSAELLEAHRLLASGIARLQTTADHLGTAASGGDLGELRAIDAFLTGELLPHEREEDEKVHPALAAAMESDEATAAFHGTHNEIYRLARTFRELVDMLPPEGPDPRTWRSCAACSTGSTRHAAPPVTGGGALCVGVRPDRGGEGRPVSRPARDAPAG
ncbi:MAG: hemerythrin domain-containing protein [Chloroflexota bacterium]